MTHENGYGFVCFAEDDWKIEADNAVVLSPNSASPADPNKTPLSTAEAVRDAIGIKTTLDQAPPTFTRLELEDPTAFNTKIVVTFSLNELGTAYCRATRSDSGETEAD